MPLTQVVELLRAISHALMKTPDEFSVLDWLPVKAARSSIALNRQIVNEKLPIRHLFRRKYAANLVLPRCFQLPAKLSNAAVVE